MSAEIIDINQAEAPGPARLLAAIIYDTLLVAGLLMLASTVVTLPVGWFLSEEAMTALPQHPLFRLWLASVAPTFFIYFWLRGGQTLGMKSWNIMVIRTDGTPLKLADAILRFVGAIISWLALGLGFLWLLVDRENRTWHDRLSGTRLIMLEKK
ncbi:MAG: RDD family protein [Candidatus Sedimenticola sp. (ex Thyasira tokunagai)]